jgi:hypothetical protein
MMIKIVDILFLLSPNITEKAITNYEDELLIMPEKMKDMYHTLAAPAIAPPITLIKQKPQTYNHI